MAVFRDMRESRLGAAGEQASGLDIVPRHGFANLFEYSSGGLVVESLAEADFFKLMRKDTQKFEVAALLERPTADTHLYVCGPKGFMDLVVATAEEKCWPTHRVHKEYFSADVRSLASDTAFDVKIASTGKVFRVAKDQTVVAALAQNGIDVPTSCQQGVCGTCLTRVIDGEPEHHDIYQSDAERARNDQFTPCCSRAKSAMLVLDL